MLLENCQSYLKSSQVSQFQLSLGTSPVTGRRFRNIGKKLPRILSVEFLSPRQ
ncbi:hypothetical protein L9F63_020845, partial [Diploptera punctata]